jgi:hypothetical protein
MSPEKRSGASVIIDGQRVPLSPEGIERMRAERARKRRKAGRTVAGSNDDERVTNKRGRPHGDC